MLVSQAEVLAKVMVDRGYGIYDTPTILASDWGVSYNFMPERDHKWITVKDIHQNKGNRSLRTGEHSDFPGVQFLFRARTDSEAKTKGKTVMEYLAGVNGLSVSLGSSIYRILNYSRQIDLMFLTPVERANQRIWFAEGFLTIFEV